VPATAGDRLGLAVVGAHLEGMPLHSELVARRARLRERTATAACYRLYRLPGDTMARPGLVRVPSGGCAIEVEVYELPVTEVGAFLRGVPPPLAIGSVELSSGDRVHGFLCEPIALEGAVDISAFGGWRAYQAASLS
jgi:hypothetical protein